MGQSTYWWSFTKMQCSICVHIVCLTVVESLHLDGVCYDYQVSIMLFIARHSIVLGFTWIFTQVISDVAVMSCKMCDVLFFALQGAVHIVVFA